MLDNNDVLRRLRFALDFSDARMVAVFALGGVELSELRARALVGREGEQGAEECTEALLGAFLDGLIVDRRGPRAGPPMAPMPLTNNEILKKIRIALVLKDVEICEILAAGGHTMGTTELSALFRKPDNRHYRLCGDQVLRKFLYGLTLRLRPGAAG